MQNLRVMNDKVYHKPHVVFLSVAEVAKQKKSKGYRPLAAACRMMTVEQVVFGCVRKKIRDKYLRLVGTVFIIFLIRSMS